MPKSVRLKVTVTFECDADPENYGTTNPAEIAQILLETIKNDPASMLEVASGQGFHVEVSRVPD